MMSKKKDKKALVPALRFSGFSGEWEERTLGNIAEVLSGYGFPEKFQGKAEGKYPFYKVSDISNSLQRGEVFLKEAANYIDDDVLKEIRATPIPTGATVFAKIGEALRLNRRAIISIPSLVDNNVAALKGKEGKTTDLFVYYIMSGIDLADHSGGAVPSVNKSTLESIPIYCTTVKEQQKIADCLSSLDEVIGLQGKKVEALKAHKKALMQSLFPAPGSSTPARRFAGFKGRWETKKLEDVIDTVTPPIKLQTSEYAREGRFPIIDQSQEQVAGWTDNKDALIDEGKSLIIFGDHTCILKIARQPFAQGADGIKIFKGGVDVDTEYLYQYLQFNPVRTEEYKRHFSILKEKEIFYPEHKEQRAIADCLSSVDGAIASAAQKLSALKEHKKGLMQQLFPSLDEAE